MKVKTYTDKTKLQKLSCDKCGVIVEKVSGDAVKVLCHLCSVIV